MTHIHLAGLGDPIPGIALGDPNVDPNLAPLLLVLADGASFNKADYTGFGYTHYEAWCVGAAGGRGGGPGQVVIPETWSEAPAPSSEWTAHMNALRAQYAALGENIDYYPYFTTVFYPPGSPPVYPPEAQPGLDNHSLGYAGDNMWAISIAMAEEKNNPTHVLPYVTRHTPILNAIASIAGGAGGGGGLHVVTGALADLPASVPVTVGQAGADGAVGQDQSSGVYNVPIPAVTWSERYDGVAGPHFSPPAAGADGGASSFGTIAKASGGKGGSPAISWPGGVKTFAPSGGAGGLGNRTLAGGGAAGSSAAGTSGADGGWDGSIGAGGGGGRGGKATAAEPGPNDESTNGGQGSFSFADTSVFGDKDVRTFWAAGGSGGLVIPGGGGGAKLPGNRKAGSKAVSYSPNGLVLLRLVRVI